MYNQNKDSYISNQNEAHPTVKNIKQQLQQVVTDLQDQEKLKLASQFSGKAIDSQNEAFLLISQVNEQQPGQDKSGVQKTKSQVYIDIIQSSIQLLEQYSNQEKDYQRQLQQQYSKQEIDYQKQLQQQYSKQEIDYQKQLDNILQQCLTVLLINKQNLSQENQEKISQDQEFLQQFEKCWKRLPINNLPINNLPINNQLTNKDYNRYTAARENVKQYYQGYIYNHIFQKKIEKLGEDQLVPVPANLMTLMRGRLSEAEKEILEFYQQGRMDKPLVKINQIRKHIMWSEPIYDYNRFIKDVSTNPDRWAKNAGLKKQHQDLIEFYENVLAHFQQLEQQAYEEKQYYQLQKSA